MAQENHNGECLTKQNKPARVEAERLAKRKQNELLEMMQTPAKRKSKWLTLWKAKRCPNEEPEGG